MIPQAAGAESGLKIPIHVIGASGRSGAELCRSLLADGILPVPVVRDFGRWWATGLPGTPFRADLADAASLRRALKGAGSVVSCGHARHAGAVLAAAPAEARLVFLGSTRKFTAWPDAHGNGVLAGEAAFLASGRSGVMLHPTMIYGAQGENNVRRLAALLRRLPIVPLPAGGSALVQPIHQDDVTCCLRAALRVAWAGPESLVIAGPDSVSYAKFVAMVAEAAGLRKPRIVSVPAGLLLALAWATRLVPGVPTIRRDEVRRLLEDKAFDNAGMQRLGANAGRPLAEGLRKMFE